MSESRLHAPEPLAFEEAARIVREHAEPLGKELLDLGASLDRVVATDLSASESIPPFASSMVDGYAVRAEDTESASEKTPRSFSVRGHVAAGGNETVEVVPGTAVRIMTGAPVPRGADAVVMLEWTSWSETSMALNRSVKKGAFIRAPGEDLRAGELVIARGSTIGPADLGVLASTGHARVEVFRQPKVAVLVTGDELLEVHEALAPGKIRSSNDYSLAGQIRRAGAQLTSVQRAKDDRTELTQCLEKALGLDVVVTSGGVSVGDHDEVQDVLMDLGMERLFWRVASSPGKPLLFGRVGTALVFGLPGNPVSSMVAFENFVRPTLRRLQGSESPERPRAKGRLLTKLRGPEDRRHFARVHASLEEGALVVREVGPHGSGNLTSMARANALAILPVGVAELTAGAEVEVMLLRCPDSDAHGV